MNVSEMTQVSVPASVRCHGTLRCQTPLVSSRPVWAEISHGTLVMGLVNNTGDTLSACGIHFLVGSFGICGHLFLWGRLASP